MATPYGRNKKNNIKNEESTLFKSLTRLFSGPLVNFRQQSQLKFRRRDLNKFKFNSVSGKQFQKTSYNPFDAIQANIMANQSRAERYSDFDQMEFCIHGDTKIAVPGGYKTLVELSQEYGLDKNFIVYSYDHTKGQITPAIGKQARKTRTDHAWKVTFENGQEIIGTEDHRLMMRDGTYRTISQLKSGDAMMPFYRKDLVHGQKDEGDGYRWIYTMHNDEGRKKGWIAEHVLIAEWIAGRRLSENEIVHHKNFVKSDNTPDNLAIMDNNEHLPYHQGIINEQRKNDGWWDNFSKKHSEWMKQNNPAERKDVTFEKILYLCDAYGFSQSNICKMLDTNPPTIKRKLKSKGFQNFEVFAKTYDPNWKNSGQDSSGLKNPRYDHAIDFSAICSAYTKDMNSDQLAEKLGTTYVKIANRIKANGYKNFSDFAENYANHKVASVEYYGFIDLYDLTVDGYKNFATDTVISHNTPEIASALDIYADEMTTHSSLTKILTIKSANQEIRGILDSLFYDVLNIDFNLFGWCRTMCKFGDMFLYLDIDPELGVKSVLGLPTPEVERLEGQDKTNPNYLQFQWNSGGLTFESWQIGHFRILGQDKYAPYGTSVLESSRRIWRQLNLLEDAMMAYRIVRAPDRRVFYLDVGNIAPEDVEQYMIKAQAQMKRNMVVDQNTGRVDLRYNPMCLTLDTKIPLLDGRTLSLQEIIDERATGKIDQYTYSVQDNTNKIVPGKIVWSGITRKNAKLIRVHLDDGATFDTTPDHKFIMRDGKLKEAKDLSIGESLMPLYRKYSTKEDRLVREGYEMVYDPSKEEYVLTHRMVAENLLAEQKEIIKNSLDLTKNKFTVIHHKDFRKQNNNPENLEYMGNGDHFRYHQQCCEKTLLRPDVREVVIRKLVEYNKSDFKRLKTTEHNKKYKKAQKMGEQYNNSELHKQHNENRKVAQTENWKKNKEARSKAMCWKIPDECIEIAKGIYAVQPSLSREAFIEVFKADEKIKKLISETNSGLGRTIDKLSRTPIEDKLNEPGYSGFAEFKETALFKAGYKNHKVSRVEFLADRQDTGCVTIEGPNGEADRHNFAIEAVLSENATKSAVFVRNSIDEDYFIPIRGQSNTKIDTLQGGSFVGAIEDVEYLRDKLFSGLKIPASYISRAKGGDEDKATLAQKDVRFARTIQRLQRALVAELERIGIIHLFTLGYRNEDLLNFSLSLNNPSKISELQELEHWKTKFEVANSAKEGFFSKRWIAENIFNLSEQDFKKIQREIFHDKQFEAAVAAIAGGGVPSEGAAGATGAILPDLGGTETPEPLTGPGTGSMPPEDGEVTTPIVPPGEGASTTGAPAKRDDRKKRDNGYKAKTSDMRSTSRKYEMNTMATPEAALGVTRRTLIPGDLSDLIKLEEGVTRDNNEMKLHETSNELKMLLLNLEKKNAKQARET